MSRWERVGWVNGSHRFIKELHLHFFQLELRNLSCSDWKGRDGITAVRFIEGFHWSKR